MATIERVAAPAAMQREWTGRRRRGVAGLAALALAAAVLVAVARDGGAGAGDALAQAAPTVRQMLAESRRLQEEGKAFPTFDVPSSTADRVQDMGQHPTSGHHALDWRDGGSMRSGSPALEYVPPPGPIDRVDDPVGGKDGWVEVGDRAFRVTRSQDGSLDHLDVPGDAKVRPVADGWEVDIPDAGVRDRYNERRMMRRAYKRLRRSHFSDKQWAANRLARKFYRAEVDEKSRRDPAWLDTPKEMNRAGWNEGNSKMVVHAGRDAGEEWRDEAGTRDRYYHWVSADGRTDTDSAGATGGSDSTESRTPVPRRDAKKLVVVRQSVRDGTVKVERDGHGDIKAIVVPVSAQIQETGAGSWQITLPRAGAALRRGQTIRIADAEDPSNKEKVESVTREWSKVSAPGDLPGEDAEVNGESSAAENVQDNAEDDGQAIDRAAYGIPERPPAQPQMRVRGGGKAPGSARDGLAAPRQVWGGWEPKRKPVTDVYAPNEDPFYCMDGSESSICGTARRPEQRHDFSLGWGGASRAQRALARERFHDGSVEPRDGERGSGRVEMTSGEAGEDREHMERDAQVEHSMESMRSVDDGVPFDKRAAQGGDEERHGDAAREDQHAERRGFEDDTDPYRYIRSGSYAKILADEDHVEHGSETPLQVPSGAARPDSWVSADDMPYKVKAPYDGSLTRVGYPNMRGGMRAEDGHLLPYDDRSGKGNNKISHKDWASDVWARASPWGVRDVRDSLNRNEEGGARRLVDERGFHEYEAGNRGFHEQRPDDPHDHWDSDESSRLRVDQFDIVGDEEGRRRAARGGDGNPDEFDSSRPAAKADYDVDMGVHSRDRSRDGEVEHVYLPYPGNHQGSAWGESDSANRVKERAAARLARRARQRQSLVRPRSGTGERREQDDNESGGNERARVGWEWEHDERSMGWDTRREARDRQHARERRDGEEEPRALEQQRRFDRMHQERQRQREMAMAQQWQRRGKGDGSLRRTRGEPLSASAKAREERVDEIAATRLAQQQASSTKELLPSAGAEQRVDERAARKLAAQARLARRHGNGATGTAAASSWGGAGLASKVATHMKSWLGVYDKHAHPQRTSLSAGVDAVDHYNQKALAHILSSAHGGDSAARLTARQAYEELKDAEHPRQAALQRSLRTSASLRASLGDYLDDYGSGPEDAAAADGINL